MSLNISRLLFTLAACAITALEAHAAIIPAAPEIPATTYLVMDFNSGQVIAGKDVDMRVEPASLTKMMSTYIISNEIEEGNLALDEMVRVSEKAWRMEGSRMFIEVNKQVSVEDLLKGVIIQSGNDATVALAEHVAGTEEVFASVMNQYAQRLGMNATHFTNSTGLPDENHYTTARDLATLAEAMIRDHPEIYKWHSIKEFSFNNITQPNRNLLLWRDDSVDGIKTGHTESAGYCLVTSAERDGMRLIAVVMGAEGMESRARASQSLLSFGFRFYETHRHFSDREPVATAQVWKGQSDTLNLGVAEGLWITVPRGQYKDVKTVTELHPRIIAPVQAGAVQGSVKLMLNDEQLAVRPLIALEPVAEGGLIERLKDEVRLLLQ